MNFYPSGPVYITPERAFHCEKCGGSEAKLRFIPAEDSLACECARCSFHWTELSNSRIAREAREADLRIREQMMHMDREQPTASEQRG